MPAEAGEASEGRAGCFKRRAYALWVIHYLNFSE
jgi:hypothetical protein